MQLLGSGFVTRTAGRIFPLPSDLDGLPTDYARRSEGVQYQKGSILFWFANETRDLSHLIYGINGEPIDIGHR